MDRNEDTDLYFYDNQLQIDDIMFSPDPDARAYTFKGTLRDVKIKNIVSESDSEITADFLVGLKFPGPDKDDPDSYSYIGHEFQLTIDKQRMVIISYSEPYGCSTRYSDWLSGLVANYRRAGLSWQEANKKAYQEIHDAYAD